jgi:hypothetical protein
MPFFSSFSCVKFRQECILPLNRPDHVFTFKIFDWNAVSKNKKLGKCHLALKDVPSGGSYFDLDIEGGGGTLCVFAKVLVAVKIEAGNPHIRKGARLRLHLERIVYHPGELIRGHIVINLHKPKHLQRLVINFEGKLDGRCLCKDAFVVPNLSITHACNFVEEDVLLPIGTYVWPFEFLLPEKLPSTTNRNWLAIVQYHILAFGQFKGNVGANMAHQPIGIVPALHLMTPSLPTRGNGLLIPTYSKEPINVVWTRFPKTFFIDKKFSIECRVDNKTTGLTLTDFKFSFKICIIHTYQPTGTNKWLADSHTEAMSTLTLSSIKLTTGNTAELKSELSEDLVFFYLRSAFSVPPDSFSALELYHYVELVATNQSGHDIICDRKPFFFSHSRFDREDGPIPPPSADLLPARFQVAKLTNLKECLPLLAPSHAVQLNTDMQIPGQQANWWQDLATAVSPVLTHAQFTELPALNIKKAISSITHYAEPSNPPWDHNAPGPILAELPVSIEGQL